MAAHQAPLSLGFSRQEHWSGLPFPSPIHESESEVTQSCLTLRDWDFPGRRTGVGCHFLLQQCRRPWFNSWVRKIPWRRDSLPTPIVLGFPHGSAGKESTCNVGDLGLIPGLGRSPAEGKCYPGQYSGLENSMDYIHLLKQQKLTCSSLIEK